ncbi:receptor activity-modifying protein 1 isoform X1 [Gracilinanus agilis]|uniref:receptor activity-modifying protein 1 isoform X1 n=1 Tax=Gracilinanus agilis TaxID=191870 RepID=UPI001CFD0E7A|nr:receptor activity-modifying protein 1 isoform X1 [Gracilinanus agilis]
MARPQAPLVRPLVGFCCLLLVHYFILVTACPEADFGQLLNEFCLTKFKLDMEEIDKSLWCDWGQTVRSYREVTNCTYLISRKLDCYWPSHQIREGSFARAPSRPSRRGPTQRPAPAEAQAEAAGRDYFWGSLWSLKRVRPPDGILWPPRVPSV